METFSALLTLCAGDSPVTGEFPAQMPVTRSFDFFFDLRINGWVNNHEAGVLRRNHAHYDVIVITSQVCNRSSLVNIQVNRLPSHVELSQKTVKWLGGKISSDFGFNIGDSKVALIQISRKKYHLVYREYMVASPRLSDVPEMAKVNSEKLWYSYQGIIPNLPDIITPYNRYICSHLLGLPAAVRNYS